MDNTSSIYCKRANIRGGFNFAMFAVDNLSAKLKPPRSFYNTSFYNYLLLHLHLKIQNPQKLIPPRNFNTAKLKPFTVLVSEVEPRFLLFPVESKDCMNSASYEYREM